MANATPLPPEFASRSVRILRSRDGAQVYKHPGTEFARLVKAGLLLRVARGYYAIPPGGGIVDPSWRPTPESIALAIGIADYGRDPVALTGISAARLLGVPPRAVAAAVVSVPVRRPDLRTVVGPIAFWQRSLAGVETEKARTELAVGWSTTAEQTLLDLADRPGLAGLSAITVSEAIWALGQRIDWFRVHHLSETQNRPSAYARALWVCAGIAPGAAPPPRLRRSVPSKGLTSRSDAEGERHGIHE